MAWVLEGCRTALVRVTWGQGPRLGLLQWEYELGADLIAGTENPDLQVEPHI